MSEANDLITKVEIYVPAGFTRNFLAYNALDSHSRKVAENTWIKVEGKILPCMSFREKDNGNLQLEVQKGFFEIIHRNGETNEQTS